MFFSGFARVFLQINSANKYFIKNFFTVQKRGNQTLNLFLKSQPESCVFCSRCTSPIKIPIRSAPIRNAVPRVSFANMMH